MIPWSNFIPYCIAEFLGALFGSLVVYVMYADHFKASEGKIDPIAIRNIFLQIQTVEIFLVTFLSRQSQQLFS